jgi:cytochrome bd-type quinol oxidase subunit 1
MNYPVWQLEFAGGGLLIALIAIIHVYIAQFAVGGGLFLVLTEMKGLRENNRSIIDYVIRHTRFFVLMTMVLGALTGVGIWFTISVLSPAATSTLIHIFVFAWAVEWLFFLTEIISLFIYYKTFDRLSERTHLLVGWVYFGAAWLSLFVINGIIDFMLTPGEWLVSGNFWDGFFNPTFWPALFFRTFLSLMIAGLFGFLTSSWLKDEALRTNMIRYCAKWLIGPFILFIASAWWYRAALPARLEEFVFSSMPQIEPFISSFAVISVVLLLGALLMAVRMPARVGRSLAAIMLIIGLLYLGAFEFIREGGRRPYIIHGHMYSNTILKNDVERVKEMGVMKAAKWVENRKITEENIAEAGKELFNTLCLHCHSIGGPLNDIKVQAGKWRPKAMRSIYRSMGQDQENYPGKARPFMPPFVGNEKEQEALTYYIFNVVL